MAGAFAVPTGALVAVAAAVVGLAVSWTGIRSWLADLLAGEGESAGLVDQVDQSVLAVDADRIVLEANPAAERLLDRSGDALVGTTLADHLPELDRELSTADAATTLRTAVTREGDDGTRHFDARCVPRSGSDSRPRGWVVTLHEVTDRERRLRELERYESIVEASGDPIYTLDADGNYTFVNRAVEEVTGYDREQLLGSHVSLIMDEEDIDQGEAIIEELLAGDQRRRTHEMVINTSDGDRIAGENHMSLLPQGDGFRGTAGVLRDISDRKARETELERYETILETVPDPVFATDDQGEFTYVNEAFAEVFEYPREYVRGEGLHFSELADEEMTRRIYDAFVDLLEDETPRDQAVLEGEGITRDGRRFAFEHRMTLLPLQTVDDRYGTAGVIQDVTDRRRRQEVLRVTNRALRHNLRTNVNTITGYAELVADGLEGTDAEYADRIVESAEWLEKLGEALRELQEAVEEGRSGETTSDLGALVDDAVQSCRRPTIRVDYAGGDRVAAGSSAVYAIREVVENAIVHCEDRHPTVDVAVDVAAGPHGEWVAVRVADDGPGIPTAEQDLVLGEGEVTQLRHGSGIGLWFTRWITELFDGEIDIERADGGGSVVTLRFRRAPDDRATAGEAGQQASGESD